MKAIKQLKQFIKKVLIVVLVPKKYHCSACGSNVAFFLPAGVKEDIFETKKIIGGGYRKNVCCPVCGSSDRTRFLDYIIKSKTDIYTNPNLHILHFAPEKCIENKIREVHRGGVIVIILLATLIQEQGWIILSM